MMKQCELRACCWTTEQTSNKFAAITITLRFCLLVEKGRADLVSLLLQRGANVKAVTSQGLNVLHCACQNGAFGKEIIPLLVKAGADVNAVDKDGRNVLSYAISRSYDFGKEMLKYLPAGSKPSDVLISESDPIGAMTLNRELGKEIDSSWFAA
jgi:ankyrin repeat protein